MGIIIRSSTFAAGRSSATTEGIGSALVAGANEDSSDGMRLSVSFHEGVDTDRSTEPSEFVTACLGAEREVGACEVGLPTASFHNVSRELTLRAATKFSSQPPRTY